MPGQVYLNARQADLDVATACQKAAFRIDPGELYSALRTACGYAGGDTLMSPA